VIFVGNTALTFSVSFEPSDGKRIFALFSFLPIYLTDCSHSVKSVVTQTFQNNLFNQQQMSLAQAFVSFGRIADVAARTNYQRKIKLKIFRRNRIQ